MSKQSIEGFPEIWIVIVHEKVSLVIDISQLILVPTLVPA
jgi:hypothetical protein